MPDFRPHSIGLGRLTYTFARGAHCVPARQATATWGFLQTQLRFFLDRSDSRGQQEVPLSVTRQCIPVGAIFKDWEIHAYPFEPKYDPNGPPPYTCSPWLVLNGLSLDEKRIFVEEKNVDFAKWVQDKFGMEPIALPFQHVNCLGESFHCATVDLVRE